MDKTERIPKLIAYNNAKKKIQRYYRRSFQVIADEISKKCAERFWVKNF